MSHEGEGADTSMTESLDVTVTEAGRLATEQFRSTRATQVLTILLTDLEGSTEQQSTLGNVRAFEITAAHRRLFRELLAAFDGQEVETAGDAFLCVFAAPSEGIRFALNMQAHMRQARETMPELPQVRCGLHQGQIVVERHAPGTGKAMDIYGLQISTAARITDLATGGQVLCTRAVFDDARAILRGEQLADLGPVQWVNHGPFAFKGVADPYDVCEVGEEGPAPLAKPAGSAKSYPVDAGDEIFGWRPGPEVLVPRTKFRLTKKLGEGGFGEVWRAQDNAGRPTVFKFCTKKSKVRSLQREYQVFSALVEDGKEPPGIVSVVLANDEGEPPYYIQMTYVAGGDLRQWIDMRGKSAPMRIKLDIAAQIARAIGRIHAADYVHRDIKPSNVLLDPQDDPNRAPTIRVCDFGIGQAVQEEALQHGTQSQEMAGGGTQFQLHSASIAAAAGTHLFIAPELYVKAESSPGRIAKAALPPADIYSLGVTLYQLFADNTAVTPGIGLPDIEEELLREYLGQCLNPKPELRPSADALAEKLDCYETEATRRATERQRRRTRRIAGVLAASLLLTAAAIGLAGYAYEQQQEAEIQRAEAVAQKQEAEMQRARADERAKEAEAQRVEAEAQRIAAGRLSYQSSLQLLQVRSQAGQFEFAREALWLAPEEHRNWEWGYACAWLSPYIGELRGHTQKINSASPSPDSSTIVTASDDHTARLWDARTGAEIALLVGHEDTVNSAIFSPVGKQILTASDDGTARLWDGSSGKEHIVLSGHEAGVSSARYDPRGGRIVSSSWDNTARVWEAESGAELLVLRGHEGGLFGAEFSPDGTRILTASGDYTARLWDASTGAELEVLRGHEYAVSSAEFSPDGTRIITQSGNTAQLWDAASGRNLSWPFEGVRWAAFGPDGKYFIGSVKYSTVTWESGRDEPLEFVGLDGSPDSAYFNSDGSLLAMSWDRVSLGLWDFATRRPLAEHHGHDLTPDSVEFSPDGTYIVTASGKTALIWHNGAGYARSKIDIGRPIWNMLDGSFEGGVAIRNALYSTDGSRILGITSDNAVRVWDSRNLKELAVLKGHDDAVNSALFCPDGTRIVTASRDHNARVWDAASGAELAVLRGHESDVISAEFSPDEKQIVTSSWDSSARVWDSDSGQEIFSLIGHKSMVISASFSADALRVLTASWDYTARVWDSMSGAELVVCQGHDGMLNGAEFSPDGSRILTFSDDATARIWDAKTGAQILILEGHDGAIKSAEYSPKGSRILTASRDSTIRVWNADTGEEEAVMRGHTMEVTSARFSQNESRIVTTAIDGTIRIWEPESGLELASFVEGGFVHFYSAIFSPDGSSMLLVASDGSLRIWRAAPWRKEDLPGDDTMTWEQRYYMWKREQLAARETAQAASR